LRPARCFPRALQGSRHHAWSALSDYASSGSAATDPAVTAYVLAAGRLRVSAPEQRVRLSQAAAKPAQGRDWFGGGVAGPGDGVAAGGGVHEAVVVGGSVQVGDALSGGDEGELGMHG
jgi:hypothetical protein